VCSTTSSTYSLQPTRYDPHDDTLQSKTNVKVQYSLEKIKTKVAKAMIDRMSFVHDVLTIVDLASCIYEEQCPQVDRGLRKAVMSQLHARMPSIINDITAWERYSSSKAVVRAFHMHVFESDAPTTLHEGSSSSQCLSPPTSPMGVKRKCTS